ncbi:MAG: hypothetical protein NT141_01645 [candidate division WWE3 bacterium]|nr:hypothetical protein [candidate division WWE3 bacterium]
MINLVQNFLAAVGFFMFPFLIGNVLTLPFYKFRRNWLLTTKWVVGALFIFSFFFVYQAITKVTGYDALTFQMATRVIAAVALICSLWQIIKFRPQIRNLNRRHLGILVPVIIGVSLLALFIWRSDSPYPSTLTWDFLEHQTLINHVINNQINFLTSKMSAAFLTNSYPPTFHALVAFTELVFDVTAPQSQGLWWILEFLQVVLVVTTSAAVAYKFTKRLSISVITAIISGLVFQSSMSYLPFVLIPQTFAAVLGIYVLAELYHYLTEPHRKELLWSLLLLLMMTILIHYVIGALSLVIAINMWLIWRWQRFGKFLLIIELITGIAVVAVSQNLVSLNILKSVESFSYQYSLIQKLTLLTQWYGYSLPVFGLIGLYLIIKRTHGILILAALLPLIVLILANVPYSLKFFAVGGFLVNLVLASGISFFIDRLKKTYLKIAALAIIIVSFLVLLIINGWVYKDVLWYHGTATQISPTENEAAAFLNKNVCNKETMTVLSDPATMGILEALSTCPSPGGVFASDQVRQSLISLNAESTWSAQPKTLLALSGRFFKWRALPRDQAVDVTVNIWGPTDLTDNDKAFIEKFSTNNPLLSEIFRNGSMVIFASAAARKN